MKLITQEEFDSFERDEHGYLYLPSGDYSLIKFIPYRSIIGARSTLGRGCFLGKWCKLGNHCSLDDYCLLGEWCTLGEGCLLGNYCSLGEGCTLGRECTLGRGCKLGEGCSLGKGCKAKSIYWGYMYPPTFEIEGKILPPNTCKKYWEKRLGIKLSGCYKNIEKIVKPHLDEWLKLDKWTDCERMILESWKK